MEVAVIEAVVETR